MEIKYIMMIYKVLLFSLLCTFFGCRWSSAQIIDTSKHEDERGALFQIENDYLKADSLYKRGLEFLEGDTGLGDYRKAFDLLESAAELGHSNALTLLGIELMKGQKLNKNEEKGYELLSKAVALKNLWAIKEMSYIHWDEKEYNKAISHLKEAVKHNDHYAAFDLGNIFLFGRPYYNNQYAKNKNLIEKEKGIELLHTASNLGNPDAQVLLGVFYLKGFDNLIDQDKNKAKEFIRRAYENPLLIERPGGRDNIEMILEDELGNTWESWFKS